jgi:hypothetical protein
VLGLGHITECEERKEDKVNGAIHKEGFKGLLD